MRLDLAEVTRLQTRTAAKKRRADAEHLEQAALFAWAELAAARLPELENMFAVPNGGKRHPAVAAKMKAEGQKKGVPDIFLDVARAGFHGLRIELKVGKNKTSADQDVWIDRLLAQGYCCYVAYGWEVAKRLIMNYLRSTPEAGLIHKTEGGSHAMPKPTLQIA